MIFRRWIKQTVLGVCVTMGAAGIAQADVWTDAGACVQNQLTALGFSAGKPDGRMTSTTRKALAAYQDANGALSTRKLNVDTAVIYCRLLGEKHSELKTYWPSKKVPYVFITSATIDAPTREYFDFAIRDALAGMRKKYGIELANTVYLSLGQTPAEMIELLGRVDRGSRKEKTEYWTDRCDSSDNVSGAAWPGMIGMCRNGAVPVGKGLTKNAIRHLVAHELFHDVQTQFVGRQKISKGRRELEFDGPVWMTEGTAEFIGTDVAVGVSYGSYNRWLRNRLRAKPELFLSEARASRRYYSRDVYYGGSLGVLQLTQRAGKKSAVTFYELMGQGVPWKQAFERAFGRTVASFYDSYDRSF